MKVGCRCRSLRGFSGPTFKEVSVGLDLNKSGDLGLVHNLSLGRDLDLGLDLHLALALALSLIETKLRY